MKRLLTLGLAVLFVTLFYGTAFAATMKLSHVRPKDTTIDKDLTTFAEAVKQATNGKVAIKLYPANALGDYTIVQERVSLGAIDMACQPSATAAEKRFQIATLPFLAEDWSQAKKLFSTGSVLRDELGKLYLEQNIRLLASWPVYFGGIALNKEPVAPQDPSVNKNCKVRIPAWKSMSLLATNLGYQPAPLPFSEAFTAVQTGVVDGVMGSGAEGYYSSFRDVTKHYIAANTHFEVWHLIINEDTFKGMSAKEQEALSAAALAFEVARWKTAEAEQHSFEKKLEEAGAKILQPTAENLSQYAAIAREKVWPEMLDDLGKEWAQGVLNKIKE